MTPTVAKLQTTA